MKKGASDCVIGNGKCQLGLCRVQCLRASLNYRGLLPEMTR